SCCSGPPKRLEDVGDFLSRNTHTFIGNLKDRVVAGLYQAESNSAAARRILDRIADKVIQHLLDSNMVAVQRYGCVGQIQCELMCLRRSAKQIEDLSSDRTGIIFFQQQLETASLDFGRVEQISDHAIEACNLTFDDAV